MNEGCSVLTQLLDFLPKRYFGRVVDVHHANHRGHGFSAWAQVLYMLDGLQLPHLSVAGKRPALDSGVSKSPLRYAPT